MEYKSLFLGILFSIGVFALKSGVGLFYFFDSSRSRLKNFGFLLPFAGVYLVIFYLVFRLLGAVDIFFDIGLVFIVGLIVTLFTAYHLADLFGENAEITIMKQNQNGEMELITKEGKKIKAVKVSREKIQGQGQRLGIAYRLQDGTMVYVPEE